MVPYRRLSDDALKGLVEEFVSREGTDYGHVEPDMDEKMRDVVRQLEDGRAVILFDDATGTCNIVRKEEL
ncbi:MAG: YheU family protein [Thermodesulfobacteriota bacterium]